MKASLAFGLVLAAVFGGMQPVVAAGPVDPDWPCIQRRQPALSLAQVWTGPQPGATEEALASSPQIRDLGQRLSLRRLDLTLAEELIQEFAQKASGPELTALFTASFTPLQNQRDRVMSGITRYAHSQALLDAKITARRHEFAQAAKSQAPDFDAIDRMEADLDWMTRIFLDRQQSLTYVCETPVILEQRAFALGRLIAAHLPENRANPAP